MLSPSFFDRIDLAMFRELHHSKRQIIGSDLSLVSLVSLGFPALIIPKMEMTINAMAARKLTMRVVQ